QKLRTPHTIAEVTATASARCMNSYVKGSMSQPSGSTSRHLLVGAGEVHAEGAREVLRSQRDLGRRVHEGAVQEEDDVVAQLGNGVEVVRRHEDGAPLRGE